MSELDRDRLLREAREANSRGQLEMAANLCDQLLRIAPGFLPAKLLMGTVAARTGRTELAIRHLNEVVQADPSCYEARMGLAMLYRGAGRLEQAMQEARHAISLRPSEPHAHMTMGMALLDSSRPRDALACFDEAIRLDPALGPAHQSRATALQRLNRRPEAVAAMKRAGELMPNSIDTLFALCQSLLGSGDAKGAAECAERALAIKPGSGPALVLLSHALADDGRFEEAEDALKRAIAADPGSYQPHHALAMLYQQMGRFEEARASLERSLALQPRQGPAYYYIAQMTKATPEDKGLVERMESILSQGGLPLPDQALLHYGSGKLLEDLGEYEKAFRHYEQGGRVSYVSNYGNAPFNRQRFQAANSRMPEVISKEYLDQHKGARTQSELPIFVCGMVRSGTTLVEQIVSSHPQVAGAGELEFWYENRWAAIDYGTGELDGGKLREIAGNYLKLLTEIAPNAARVTDKLPGNAGALGVINLALPGARLLHVRRNPVDTCLSIFATWFQRPPEFTASKEDIVFAYQCYLDVMDHWRKVLPSDRFMDVPYEELTADPEGVTRRIIAFCGLEWDDACLSPDRNARRVKTPSLWQVRRPVNSSAVERWRRFEPWLGAFLQLQSSVNQEI